MLRNDPCWSGCLGYGSFNDRLCLTAPFPGDPAPEDGRNCPRPWTVNDYARALELLQVGGFPKARPEAVRLACDQRGRERTFDPLAGRLRSLTWDGIPRITGGTTREGEIIPPFLTNFFGVTHTPYSEEVGRILLLSAAARALKPGCKVDTMVVLEGAQGIGKSTACRILALADEWFSDDLPDLSNKDCLLHLRGRWLVEIAELRTFGRAATARLKFFLSGQTDRYRPPYGRLRYLYRHASVAGGTRADLGRSRSPPERRRALAHAGRGAARRGAGCPGFALRSGCLARCSGAVC
jgi:hypothetical protein